MIRDLVIYARRMSYTHAHAYFNYLVDRSTTATVILLSTHISRHTHTHTHIRVWCV